MAGAIADYTVAIELDPQSARAYKNRGDARLFLEDYAGAIADFDVAVALNPALCAAIETAAGPVWPRETMPGPSLIMTPRSCSIRGMPGPSGTAAGHATARATSAVRSPTTTRPIRLEPQNYANYLMRGNAYYHLRHKVDADRDYAQAFALDPAGYVTTVIDILAQEFQRDADHFANCEMHLRRDPGDFSTLASARPHAPSERSGGGSPTRLRSVSCSQPAGETTARTIDRRSRTARSSTGDVLIFIAAGSGQRQKAQCRVRCWNKWEFRPEVQASEFPLRSTKPTLLG